MLNTQLYEKIIKVKSAAQKAKLISAVLSYILYLMIWVFIGIFNPQKLILMVLGGILSDALIIFITLKYFFLEFLILHFPSLTNFAISCNWDDKDLN